MKLGKKPAVHDPRTLAYARYRATSGAPRTAHWGHDLSYDMDGNDQYGDCVEAAYAHQIQIWGARAGTVTPVITATDVLGAYSALTGFNPNDPNSDQGTDMLAANKFWRSAGLKGVKIDAFASVNPQNADEVRESVAWYGSLNIGVALPISAQNQVGDVWDVVSGPDGQAGSWGGHCIPIVGYNSKHLWCVTWGALQGMTWDFLRTYCDEAYVFLSKQWIGAAGTSPSKLAWGQLEADLANL